MFARFVLIAAIVLASEPVCAAAPAKPASQPQAQPQAAPSEVVLASADDVATPPTTSQQAPAAPKRRIGRVTTCRCGDQPAQPEQ
ncbi:MAG TPA: hypothetical protein VHU79_09285 [Sphingomicrobium sp.]|jgi:hypothetical protein|nr:hypothetical protein [Sphingomicrobium sp.]